MKCFATAGEPAEDAELEQREEEVDAEWREKLEREWRAKKLKDEFRRKRYPLPACSAIGRFTVYEVHDSLSHGDVCRNPREPGRFECPEGCNRMPGAPFCASNESVPTAEVPCHAPNARDALRLPGMLRLALCVAEGALAREESRGAHHRSDFPERDDSRWLNRTLARWPAGADAPSLSYEPVGLIDVPPSGRGYGKAARIDMDISLDAYNETVADAQAGAGRTVTAEPAGSRLRPGDWSIR